MEEDAISIEEKANQLASAILDKKGEDVVILGVTELVPYADSFIIATGNSPPHLDAMTDAVVRRAKESWGLRAVVEGRGGTSWVLIDCGDMLVHLFSREARGFYDLDGLWCDAPRTELSGEADDTPGTEAGD
jgi:ribosome-associated protein